MNLKQLEAFIRVADSGSFSKAAKELYLTQPTVSAHISSLEKELNARLFIRNTKEVSLSQDGKKLYDYARKILDIEAEIRREFCDTEEQEHQCIRIAASTIPAQYLLPGILAKFSEKHPSEQFEIIELDSMGVVEQIIERNIDLGFTGTELEKKHCTYIPFYKDELVIITPNDKKFQKLQKQKKGIEWITEEQLIMREEGSGTRKESEKQLRHAGIDLEKLNIVASMENQEMIKKSVENGLGISIISKLAAASEVQNKKLLEFSLPIKDGERNLNIVYNKNCRLTHAAQKFIKIVKELYP